MTGYDPEARCTVCQRGFTRAEWDVAFKIYEGTVLTDVRHLVCGTTASVLLNCTKCFKVLTKDDEIVRTQEGVFHKGCVPDTKG
jgi:hypothetical protein